MKIGLFYGSDTGKTKEVAEKIADLVGTENIDLHNLVDTKPSKVLDYEYIIFGAPTWYDGQLQADWETNLPTLSKLDFSGKKVAIYGLGDQYGYAEYYLDAVGVIADAVTAQGADLHGLWANEGYEHTASKGERDGYFLGLALDEDNQAELTDERLNAWLSQVWQEFGFEVEVEA
ncbi:MAG: flavodoxin [Thermoflexibacter sp.]|jgi:flavodoxin long chain|nr:flavodoxin [Thermoflexibacter sp.]